MKRVKNLVVGCGLTGMVLAERLASELKEEVLIIDRRSHIGGNIYDYKDESGVTVHQYGPHVFHTKDKKVWDYLGRFTDWHYFMYRVKAVIDGREVNVPFNLDSLHQVFPRQLAERLEEKLIAKFGFNRKVPILELRQTDDGDFACLADYVYEKVFLGYTVKQWGYGRKNWILRSAGGCRFSSAATTVIFRTNIRRYRRRVIPKWRSGCLTIR